ncbi:hypothetical protein [Dysgonomonas capnocytophagoides]|uniref:phosphorylase family protein n=1 Tax=Dysgonomonas capnocytophagoides TaxID=45254 RepID=UPI00291D2A03|nr:hypothetical protein DCPSUM001_18380 [Dysgonomonas capnocytophagoides]
MAIAECKYDNLKHLFDGSLILLVTVTEIETETLRSNLIPINGYDHVLKVYKGNYTYYIGKFGKYNVAHVQSSMGSISKGSSIVTVKSALDCIKSKIVIMIGIAFGIDSEKQNIGDVLLSETIIAYNPKRIGKNETVQRGSEPSASTFLLNRFKNITTWEYILDCGNKAKLIPAKMLSGEELIDNQEHRDELLKIYPEVKGGEMEGIGVATACDNCAEWILVKGICDFADGEKGTDKKKRQQAAIESAVSVCLELFSSETLFLDKGINPNCANIQQSYNIIANINDVLFDVYDLSKEDYYIERAEDIDFNQKSNQYGIWIYGPTGSGKTNLILRNLLRNQSEFVEISLGACSGQKNIAFFNEILYSLFEKTGKEVSYPKHKALPSCNRDILKLLEKNYKDKEIVIFIEEIPIETDLEYKSFMNGLYALICGKSLITGLNRVMFVLSSIKDPSLHISRNAQKIHQYIYFMPFKYWEKELIDSLIKKIEIVLELKLSENVRAELIQCANGSPRFIKKFFRNILAQKSSNEDALLAKIKETNQELKQFGYV